MMERSVKTGKKGLKRWAVYAVVAVCLLLGCTHGPGSSVGSDRKAAKEDVMTERTKQRKRNVATVRTMFEEMAKKDVDAWMSHWADVGSRQLIPYSPDDFPKIVEGKETLRKVYRDLVGGYGRLVYTHIDIFPMEDPDRVVAEWGVDIEVTATKGRYRNELIGIFGFKDGKVVELKEYFNPDNFKKAIAGNRQGTRSE